MLCDYVLGYDSCLQYAAPYNLNFLHFKTIYTYQTDPFWTFVYSIDQVIGWI